MTDCSRCRKQDTREQWRRFGCRTLRHQDTLGHFGTGLKTLRHQKRAVIEEKPENFDPGQFRWDTAPPLIRFKLRHQFCGAEVSKSVLMPKCLVAEVSGSRRFIFGLNGLRPWAMRHQEEKKILQYHVDQTDVGLLFECPGSVSHLLLFTIILYYPSSVTFNIGFLVINLTSWSFLSSVYYLGSFVRCFVHW